MRFYFVSLSVCLLLLWNTAHAQLHVTVPRSRAAVMIDGKLSDAEGKDAARVAVPNTANLYIKQAAGFVYFAVEFTGMPSGIVDLYLSPGNGHIYDLHASAKLGEREPQGGKWPDWLWWNNRDWVANVSRVDSWGKRSFLPEPVREFQLLRVRFPASVWRLRLELRAMTAQSQTASTVVFPPGTGDQDVKDWLVLDLK